VLCVFLLPSSFLVQRGFSSSQSSACCSHTFSHS
jgi:hypothetical protein